MARSPGPQAWKGQTRSVGQRSPQAYSVLPSERLHRQVAAVPAGVGSSPGSPTDLLWGPWAAVFLLQAPISTSVK